MDNKATTKRMIGAVVLVLVAALLLAALLRSKKQDAPDMAMNNTAETKPILGFPGVAGSGEQKPSLINEGVNPALQGGAVQQNMAAQGQAGTAQQGGGLFPDVNLPNMQTNTTDLSVRPAQGESRQIVDTDGKIKDGTGNMGGNAAVPSGSGSQAGTGQATGGQGQAASGVALAPSSSMGGSSASTHDKPATTDNQPPAKKPANPVLVNEHRVPAPTSAESKAKAEADKVAKEKAAKEAAAKAAAEKAAADKSRELAAAAGRPGNSSTGTGAGAGGSNSAPSAGGAGSFNIQFAAVSDQAKANSIAASLSSDGQKVAVTKATVSGKTIYRVHATGFKTKADASNAQASLKRRYTQNEYVKNSFVTSN
ncbi:MAG: SPOR domain-containing protein [Candidatus Thiothrix moscowensis]|nr:SPOR domain-containing protein [Candidatus Thiothrix moscowensis]